MDEITNFVEILIMINVGPGALPENDRVDEVMDTVILINAQGIG